MSPCDAVDPSEGPDVTLNGPLAEGSMHSNPAAEDSELGAQPAYAPADQEGDEEDLSDMALEDAIMAAHHSMAGEGADESAPELLDPRGASAAADGGGLTSQLEGLQASHAGLPTHQQGLGMGDLPGLVQSAANEQAQASEMTFLAQLRPSGNADLSPVGSEDEDRQLQLSTADGALELREHALNAQTLIDHSLSPAAEASSNDAFESEPGQADAVLAPDEAARIAAWQAYWQSEYEAGAYQPPPQGPPGLPLSCLHTGSDLQAPLSTRAAALSMDHDPARNSVRGTTSPMHSMHGFEHTAGSLDLSQKPERLQDDFADGSPAEAAASSSPQGPVKEGQPGLQSPGLSAWQPWLEWWHGIAGNEPATGDYTTAEVNPPGTASGTTAADQAAPSEAPRPNLQPGQATQHIGDEDLIAVPVSLLRRYQQLEWEDWVRRWQAWQAQQGQPAHETSGNL